MANADIFTKIKRIEKAFADANAEWEERRLSPCFDRAKILFEAGWRIGHSAETRASNGVWIRTTKMRDASGIVQVLTHYECIPEEFFKLMRDIPEDSEEFFYHIQDLTKESGFEF